jgi:hypothetical protein
MKVHPFIAAAALLLAGVMAFAATFVVQHRRARGLRPPPRPELEVGLPARLPPPSVAAASRFRLAPPRPAAPPAELHVRVTGPHGIALDEVDVLAHRRGDPPDDWTVLDPDDEAEADADDGATSASSTQLAPGRYDLRVEASGMRPVRLDDVATGSKVVGVALTRAPALLGAVGALGEPGCAGVTVSWSGPQNDGEDGDDGDDGETGEAILDEGDCTFVVEALPAVGPVTVTATRGSLRERALVTPPLAGDPAFLCLAPPCDAAPASLLVYLGDTSHHQVDDATLTWTLQADEFHGAMGTSTGAGQLFVHGRHAGETLALHAERDGHAVESTAVLGPGVTEVLLTFPAAPGEPTDHADEGILDVDDTPEDVAAATPQPSLLNPRDRVYLNR